VAGRRPVQEALAAHRPLLRLWVARPAGGGAVHGALAAIVRQAREQGVPVEAVQPAVLDRLAAGAVHQGVVAVAAAAPYAPEGAVLERVRRQGREALVLVVDGVEDPRNLGALLRTAEAVGAAGAYVPRRRAAGLSPAAVKAAAGALAYLPVERVGNVARLLEELQAEGLWVVGTDPQASRSLYEVDLTPPLAVVVGAEGQGMHALVRRRCNLLVRIPMRGQISSLNVSVAAALVLYEAVRQREQAKERCGRHPAEGGQGGPARAHSPLLASQRENCQLHD
jgi:23S rRNA (guanosine2251-2'-O)-methyltransferase